MRQVLINLLRNAVKFTEIGVITFKVGYQTERTQFQVEDRGIGIAPDAKGTGLKLAIRCQLVQLMSGAFKVKSTLRLPRKSQTCSI
ncbi:ATP-binding protein [Coleofasciculus sp. FACHB-SPT36]|uniref:ATP-binding protein n=1 Tax=Cyanophyceae TaxID=3028117 RepID=UPI00168AA6DE|nr:ATP-binding protein [Coleofasciculus sp. FACHB-SPT36]MBD2541926.1 hypothetical protein [Coleofasciculus sp. FACHB-SPT36]